MAEALTNIAKHAEASEAHVEIAVDDHVTMVITDDGRGGAVLDGGSIQDRVAAFGGTLDGPVEPRRGHDDPGRDPAASSPAAA